jgi:hypothetical protein
MPRGSFFRTPRHSGHRPSPPSEANIVEPLLVNRKATAVMLGNVNVATIRRLEKKGILKPIRLDPKSKTGQVFYPLDTVRAIAKQTIAGE